jgi:HD-GYP domain-containing protein (c-di-GMP phosphodiesterase class II)
MGTSVPAERQALRRLAAATLITGAAALLAVLGLELLWGGRRPSVPAAMAVLLSVPGLFATSIVLAGAVLAIATLARRGALLARLAAIAIEGVAAAGVALFSTPGAHVAAGAAPWPAAPAAPAWWQPSWLGPAALFLAILNAAGAPAEASLPAALLGVAACWPLGLGPVAAGAGAAIVLATWLVQPLRRSLASGDYPLAVARATRAADVLDLHGHAGAEQPAVGEADLRAAAAALKVDALLLLVLDSGRRQRVPTGELCIWDGEWRTLTVTLDAASIEQPDGLGFVPPPGLEVSPPRYVKRLFGQRGELARLIVPEWHEPAGEHDRTTREALLALLAATWSLRLDNSRLALESEARLLDIVESLITSVEAKDPYTSGHSKRVCRYSVLIAEAMGYRGPALDEIAIGAALHDVGKLGIPEQVLHKRGKLDAAEWELMKAHPKIGARIIDSFNHSRVVLEAIFHHHERFDGTGYPSRLAGEAIPLHARIVGVADALDAMTSGRAYQHNRTMAQALEELRANAGKQFCPRVVEATLSIPLERLQAIAPRVEPEPDAPPVSQPNSPWSTSSPSRVVASSAL